VIHPLVYDIAHLLAGGMVLVSFMLLYQDRMHGLLNVFALHALVLALSVAWEALVQHAPHLFITAAIALVVKAIVIPLAREDLAFALSIILLGLLVMVTRRNAVSQVVGFMSLENGLVLAATGAKSMPFVVEISVAFSILSAFIVIGIFLFRIRERFDTVDVQALDRFRGERQ
jgi:hydrogenase-4 component E